MQKYLGAYLFLVIFTGVLNRQMLIMRIRVYRTSPEQFLKVNVNDSIKAADGFKGVHIIKATLPREIHFLFFIFLNKYLIFKSISS